MIHGEIKGILLASQPSWFCTTQCHGTVQAIIIENKEPLHIYVQICHKNE